MIPTWIVYSLLPPECPEEISCSSMVDAGRAWAMRQFRKGFLPHDGTLVIVRAKNDATPRHSAYRLKISIANAPAFHVSFDGLAFEDNGDPKDKPRG